MAGLADVVGAGLRLADHGAPMSEIVYMPSYGQHLGTPNYNFASRARVPDLYCAAMLSIT